MLMFILGFVAGVICTVLFPRLLVGAAWLVEWVKALVRSR